MTTEQIKQKIAAWSAGYKGMFLMSPAHEEHSKDLHEILDWIDAHDNPKLVDGMWITTSGTVAIPPP